jgi:hypothetical protein
VQYVIGEVVDGCGDAVEQSACLVDRQVDQAGLATVAGAPFFAASRVMTRNAAAAMERVMCRYQAL